MFTLIYAALLILAPTAVYLLSTANVKNEQEFNDNRRD